MSWNYIGHSGTIAGLNVEVFGTTIENMAPIVPNDLYVLDIQTFGGPDGRVPTLSEDWTVLGSWANGTSRHLVAFRKMQSGDVAPVVLFSGLGNANDTQVASIHAFRSSMGNFSLDVVGAPSINPKDDSIGPIGGIAPAPGALVVLCAGKTNDFKGAASLPGWSIGGTFSYTHGTDAGTALLFVPAWPGGSTGALIVTDTGSPSTGLGQGLAVSFVEHA